jgi:hypothetical protein
MKSGEETQACLIGLGKVPETDHPQRRRFTVPSEPQPGQHRTRVALRWQVAKAQVLAPVVASTWGPASVTVSG